MDLTVDIRGPIRQPIDMFSLICTHLPILACVWVNS